MQVNGKFTNGLQFSIDAVTDFDVGAIAFKVDVGGAHFDGFLDPVVEEFFGGAIFFMGSGGCRVTATVFWGVDCELLGIWEFRAFAEE